MRKHAGVAQHQRPQYWDKNKINQSTTIQHQDLQISFRKGEFGKLKALFNT